MLLLNRVNLIGKIADDPRVYFTPNHIRIMSFELVTDSDKSLSRPHHVVIEDPLIIEYAHTYLFAGSVVWVEGQLEYFCSAHDNSKDVWIVVSRKHGRLHPLMQ
ncbi:MAG: single-stranded DNA-binding protein [Pseudomonadota bacterium]